MSDTNVVELVDDQDERVEYSGEWVLSGVAQEYHGTTHGTYVGGSQVKFTFRGSSVEVYGTLSDNRSGTLLTTAPVSTYVLDGSSPQTFSPPFPNGVSYRQLFYQSSDLNDEQHTLIITSTASDAAFWLDYFQITPTMSSPSPSPPLSPTPPPPLPPTMRTTSTTLSSTTGLFTQLSPSPTVPSRPTTVTSSSVVINGRTSQTPSFTSQVGVTPSSTQNGESLIPGGASPTSVNSSVTSTTNTVPVGAIAGGVIGGVALILLACLLLLLYRRRTRSRNVPSNFGIQPHDVDNINPFLTSHTLAQEARENENTRFLGDVSPFTNHQSCGNRGPQEKAAINFTGGPIVSQAMENPSYFGHPTNPLPLDRAGRPEERAEGPFNRGASPRGEGSTSTYVADLVTVDTPPAYEPRR